MTGYHKNNIPIGTYGKETKITEEYLEFIDSLEQNNKIMAIFELSDLLGAIEGYIEQNFSLTLNDLLVMKNTTRHVFETGYRKSK